MINTVTLQVEEKIQLSVGMLFKHLLTESVYMLCQIDTGMYTLICIKNERSMLGVGNRYQTPKDGVAIAREIQTLLRQGGFEILEQEITSTPYISNLLEESVKVKKESRDRRRIVI